MTSEGKGKGSTFYIELPSYLAAIKDDVFSGLYDSVLDHGRIFGGGIGVSRKMSLSRALSHPKRRISNRGSHSNSHSESQCSSNEKSRSGNQSNSTPGFQRLNSSANNKTSSGILDASMVAAIEDEAENVTHIHDIEQGQAVGQHRNQTNNGFLSNFMNLATFSSKYPVFHSQVVPVSMRQEDNELHDLQDALDSDNDNSENNCGDMMVTDCQPIASIKAKNHSSHPYAPTPELARIPSIGSSQNMLEVGNVSIPPGISRKHSSSKLTRSHLSFSSSSTRAQILNILIVDDSVPNRKMLSRLLTREKHVVTEAADGVEAVEIVYEALQSKTGKQRFDLILMDFYMTHMCGPEAIKAIRKLGYTGMILGVSGVMDDDVNLFMEAGANLVLCKPISVGALWKALRGTNFVDV